MKQTDDKQHLVFLPLGGVGEIGRNLYLYGFGEESRRQWIAVDCGISFPDYKLPGVDAVLPDMDYVSRLKLLAIIITHAHEDHYGALGNVWNYLKAPIYVTQFAREMIAGKARNYRGWDDIGKINTVTVGKPFTVGPFNIEYLPVPHSIPESNSLAIRTPNALVLHSGDWKIDSHPGIGDPLPLKRLRQLGDEGVSALICDSTNADKQGTSISERDVEAGLSEIIANAPRLVGVTMFSSHVGRMLAIARAAKKAGRKVVIAGRALEQMILAAGECGYLNDVEPFIPFIEADGIADSNKVVVCTGSQGEPRSALARIANDQHSHIKFGAGDTVIFSSRTIPGNEREVGAMINKLIGNGVRVVTEHEAPVHVTGHPRQEELAVMYDALKPELLIPVHGEEMHIQAQANFAETKGIKKIITGRDGDLFVIKPTATINKNFINISPWLRDGNLVAPAQTTGVHKRRKLSYAGIVMVSVIFANNFKSVLDIECRLNGLPECDADGCPLKDIIIKELRSIIKGIVRRRRSNIADIEWSITKLVKSSVFKVWGKKPVCEVIVSVADRKNLK